MRLVTYRQDGSTRAGAVEGKYVRPLPFASVDELLRAVDPEDAAKAAEGGDAVLDLMDLDLAPVVTGPGKIVCLGLNYAGHIAEMRREKPTYPTLFAKFASTLTGPYDDIAVPNATSALDWEAELAIVIGRPVRGATHAQARAAIAGYTILNDVSARDWQGRTTQWLQGKNFDATTPIGPVLVTADEVGDASDFSVSCLVNGEVVQEASTKDLVFDPVEAVAYISGAMSLQPGDVIATGTPAGVGAGRDPQRFLVVGDVLTTRIDGLGECRNLFVCPRTSQSAAPSLSKSRLRHA